MAGRRSNLSSPYSHRLLSLAVGYTADRFGSRAVFIFSAIGTLLFAWPLWLLMHQDALLLVFLGQLGLRQSIKSPR